MQAPHVAGNVGDSEPATKVVYDARCFVSQFPQRRSSQLADLDECWLTLERSVVPTTSRFFLVSSYDRSLNPNKFRTSSPSLHSRSSVWSDSPPLPRRHIGRWEVSRSRSTAVARLSEPRRPARCPSTKTARTARLSPVNAFGRPACRVEGPQFVSALHCHRLRRARPASSQSPFRFARYRPSNAHMTGCRQTHSP